MKFIDTSKYSTDETKLLGALINNAYSDLKTKVIFEISILELMEQIDFLEVEKLIDSLRVLSSTWVKLNIIDENSKEETWITTPTLSSFQIEGTKCKYAFSQVFKDIICRKDIYSDLLS